MMKQARTLLSRSLCSNQSSSLFEGSSNSSALRGFATRTDSYSTTKRSDVNKPSGRVFAPYAIFKGRAALSVEPVLPTFTKIEPGNLRVDRRGSVMMTFMPAVSERKYDWEKKQLFALSPTEVGSVISMGPQDSSEFFHDPSMKSSNAGQVRKSLSIKPLADSTGYFFQLSVTDNIHNTNDRIVVPVSKAEFAVLKSAFSFALPHILGWARITGGGVGMAAQGIASLPKADPMQLELEWGKE
ncbi:Single-stranded DNA-binding protein WHY2 [Hirschfeldia incana]|nr:Single-stranded DNA-binding protein WHY2 [Hirschfeldia incana]